MSTGVALVTGTSSGIGLQTAAGLARHGFTVVATMRDPGRREALLEACGEGVERVDVRRLDVTDPQEVASCVAGVLADHGRIDVLVNNAGRGAVASLEQLSDDDLQAQLDVNYLGVARVTRAVLPVMRAAGSGRVVTVTSVGGVIGQPFADAYCGAKFAVEGLMQSLAPVAARFGVTISVVEPGAVASEFVGNVDGLGTDGAAAEGVYAELLAAYLRRTEGAFAGAQAPQETAAIVVEAATTDEPRFRWQTSAGASAFAGLSLADLDGSRVLDTTTTWLT